MNTQCVFIHKNGYESVYSGLKQMLVSEGEEVVSGQAIGRTEGFAAFELRKERTVHHAGLWRLIHIENQNSSFVYCIYNGYFYFCFA